MTQIPRLARVSEVGRVMAVLVPIETISYSISKQYTATMIITLTMEFHIDANGIDMKGKPTLITNYRITLSVN
jgi:hypothetical protein